jgi:type I restriction enzyme S subunit
MKPTTEWHVYKLDELGSVGRGKSKHRPRNDETLYGGNYPFFQTGDIKAANFYLTEYLQTYNEKGLAQSKLWQPGTLCITIAANIAETAILGIPGCFPDSVVGFVPDTEKADVRFIKYYVDTIKLQMQNMSRGTTQDNLSVDKLLSFDFCVPPLLVQRRIAGILSDYDELIENNQRRIRILEDMARSLYREWFVNFRYPGNESVPFVESPFGKIPQGWEVNRLGELFDFVGGAQPPKNEHIYEERTGYVRFIQNRDYGKANHLTFVKESKKNKLCERLDIMVDKYGEAGKTRFGLDGAYNVALAKIQPRQHFYREWLRGYLSQEDFGRYLVAASQAATRASLNSSHFNVDVAVPTKQLMEAFQNIVEPMLKQTLTHKDSIENLRCTRDLLLPRMLSGQVPLSGAASEAIQ